MAVNIIDALIVTLGLDATDYKRGVREASDARKRMSEEERGAAQDEERSAKRRADAFRTVRNEVAGLILVAAGANSFKNFVGDLIGGAADTGRLAVNLGLATEQLSAWEGAVKRVGGNAKDADQALQSMTSAFQSYQLTGTTGNDADYQGLGVNLNDLRSPTQALLKMAEAGERMGRPEFVARLSRIGIPASTIQLLERGRAGVEQLVAEQEKLGVVTDKDAIAAQALQDRLARISSQIQGAARPSVMALADAFSVLLDDKDDLNAFFGGIASAIHRIADGMRLARAGFADFVTMWHQLRSGDFAGALQTFLHGSVENVKPTPDTPAGAPPTGSASAGGTVAAYMRANGFTDEQARGIEAGIHAEGGGLGMAANGAFGLGQWRGDRQRRLFAQYGRAPSREQQLAYLVAELRGGDPGGASVRRAGSADEALRAYIGNFMRPGPGYAGDINRGRAYLGGNGLRAGSSPASTTQTTSVGQITIYTAATDAHGIAHDMRGALAQRGLVVQAGSGMRQ